MTEQELTTKEKQAVRAEEQTRRERYFVPEVDIRETDDALWLSADVPGATTDGVHVELDGDVLQLEGVVSTRDYEGLAPLYTEYNVGNYLRRFTLSSDVDSDRIVARMRNGVLTLEMPKAERARPRKIAIGS